MSRHLKRKGILVLSKADAKKERDFELELLFSLSLSQRFSMMETKSQELKSLLTENGHRKSPAIIKRK